MKDNLKQVQDQLEVVHEKLALRQVIQALNDKLLRSLAATMQMPVQRLWDRHIHSIGKLPKDGAYSAAWSSMQHHLQIPFKAKELQSDIRESREGLDGFVRVGGFRHLSDDELRLAADRHFIGDQERLKPTFLFILQLNRRLSGSGSLYNSTDIAH